MTLNLRSLKNYLLVAKPGIVLGNLISAAGGFLLASKGCLHGGLLPATMLGISLSVAGGCVFNTFIARDLDRKMTRTRNRVLARGLISPSGAVVYAALLALAGLALLFAATNRLCAAIVLAGLGIYVVVYSLGLKRRSVHAPLVGSLAGAAPPLAGYCAVTGRFDTGALILMAVFALWQVPHADAVAIFHRADFALAGIPVLAVKRGVAAARRHIVMYIPALMSATLMLTAGGYTGYGFLAVAAAVNLSWLAVAYRGGRTDEQRWAKRLFIVSILSITALSVMMAIDFTPTVAQGLLMTAAP
jgi:protoheme IX farnesyltransferase